MQYFKWLVITLLAIVPFLGISQSKKTLSGYIRSADTGEELIGATVYFKELGTGSSANIYGFYSVSVPEGVYHVEFSFLGFQTVSKEFDLSQNQTFNIELPPSSASLKEVEVVGEAENKNVEQIQMSTINMNMETIKKIPALMGEVDVLRSIQLLPGVQSGGEGSTGFFVRGGGLDQNLILLDGAPVYNAAHLFGFFSVFNQDAIKEAELFKGGIPAQFGGRLSSVLDVRMKEGNSKRLSVSGGLGLVSSRLTIEGPLWKDKVSFVVSGRRTYGDLFLKVLFPESDPRSQSKLFFYDLNGKINWRINDKNRVFISAYMGRDKLGAADLFEMGWGNKTVTTRWNHLFSDKIFSNLTLIYSNFDYGLGVPSGVQEFDWVSKIIDYGIKNDYTYYINPRNTLKFGVQSTIHTFSPAEITPGEENDAFNEIKFFERKGWENGIYIGDEQRIGSRLAIEVGVRLTSFSNMGIDTVYEFNSNYDRVGYDAYEKGDLYNTYFGIEPRLAAKYTLNDVSSIKASYNRMNQYMHLATNTSGGAPLDVWMPVSPNLKPGVADQVALGYFRNLKNNMFEASAEVYYKTMSGQVDFKDNANILLNKYIEGDVRQGIGESYGLEFLFRKQKGDLTGWVSYTLSKATRTVDGINGGNQYLASFHRANNLAIVASYAINSKIDLSANWIYTTGAPITAPTGRMDIGGELVPVYSDRNDAKMPDYHRLDVGLNWKITKEEEKRWQNSLNFSIYNLYARKNAYTISFVQDPDTHKPVAKMTYLFSIIPSITWNFKF
ncbi:MAG: TonB-dependent receptor [Flavobacteriales bacterium]|nr:TonB-dependent receptor [Flavobacteriales bacterium]